MGGLVVIIGAGPYGLAAAAHLRAAGVETRVFGEAMAFWQRQMPTGMLLRSYWDASHIADPLGDLTLDDYQSASRCEVPRPIPLERFVDYGGWYARHVVPDLDTRQVVQVARSTRGFRLELADGETVQARRVVIAAGIAPFTRRPAAFAGIGGELASHTADHAGFARFAGKRVAVVGGGQSALESAALLHEAGATVEVIIRAPLIHWLRYGAGSTLHAVLHSARNPFRPLLFPASDIGPPGLNYLVDKPTLFMRIPTRALRSRAARRAIRPAGSGWLRARLADVPLTTGRTVTAATPTGDTLQLTLSDGSARIVDHALLATGYAVDIARYPFLAPDLAGAVRQITGYPRLTRGFESSVPGLHFLGAPAAESHGPLMRFVAGTGFAARALAHAVRADTPRRLAVGKQAVGSRQPAVGSGQ